MKKKKIVKIRKGRDWRPEKQRSAPFVKPPRAPEVTGEFSGTRRGFGFVMREHGEDVFIPASRSRGALDGDRVRCAVFREGDRLVLVDYKTDKVDSAAELSDRYRSQMLFYKQALETIFGLPVTEMLLYSFALGTTVEVK